MATSNRKIIPGLNQRSRRFIPGAGGASSAYQINVIPDPSITPTISVTPSITRTPSVTPSITKTPSVTPTVTRTPSVTPTVTPSITPTITVTPSITPSITPTITVTPTKTVTPTPTASPAYVYLANVYGCSSVNNQAQCGQLIGQTTIYNGLTDFTIGAYYVSSSKILQPISRTTLTPPYNIVDSSIVFSNCNTACNFFINPPLPSVTPTVTRTPSVTPTVTPSTTPLYFTFTLLYSNISGNDACLNGVSNTYYANSSTLADFTSLYTDSGLTTPASDGFYCGSTGCIVPRGRSFVQVINGNIAGVGPLCPPSPTPTVSPTPTITPTVSITPSTSNPGPITIVGGTSYSQLNTTYYLNQNFFNPTLKMYYDAGLTQPVPNNIVFYFQCPNVISQNLIAWAPSTGTPGTWAGCPLPPPSVTPTHTPTPSPALALGQAYAGGYIAYLDGLGHGFVINPGSYSNSIVWGPSSFLNITSQAIGAGGTNTAILAANSVGIGGANSYYATNRNEGGYTDWVIPTVDECQQIFNSRPSSQYQQVYGYRWTSSEIDATNAYYFDFYAGNKVSRAKSENTNYTGGYLLGLYIRYF